MNNKTINIILLLIIFIFFFSYFSIIRTAGHDLLAVLNLTESFVQERDWNAAAREAKNFRQAWNEVKYWIMINNAEAPFASFENNMDYFIAGITGKQFDTALGNIRAARNFLENALRVVPEP